MPVRLSRFKSIPHVLVLMVLSGMLLLASCHKGEFSVSQTIVQPFVELAAYPEPELDDDSNFASISSDDSTAPWAMGLSLYVFASVPSNDGLQMVVTSPGGSLSWSFVPSATVYEGSTYYGSSNIMMPDHVLLPKGTWSLGLLYKDGRTIDVSFEVSYTNVSDAIERSSGEVLPFFDTTSNLTVIQAR